MKTPQVQSLVLFSIVATLGLGGDLWTKSVLFDWLGLPGTSDPYWLVDGVFGFQTAVNPGAMFGMGAGKGLLFAGFSIVALLGIGFWLIRGGGMQNRKLSLVLGLISGGILGNLYDRLGLWTGPFLDHPLYQSEYDSGVRDWILFRVEGVPLFDPWPNFNIADACLVVGAISLILLSFLTPVADNAGSSTSESVDGQPNP
ncbi:MAG: signal peptidase II [Planctomycetota bacterium]